MKISRNVAHRPRNGWSHLGDGDGFRRDKIKGQGAFAVFSINCRPSPKETHVLSACDSCDRDKEKASLLLQWTKVRQAAVYFVHKTSQEETVFLNSLLHVAALPLLRMKETFSAYHYTHKEHTATCIWQQHVYLQLQKEI